MIEQKRVNKDASQRQIALNFSEKFGRSDKDVQSMRFSSQWWRQYKLHFGITVVRKQGSQSFFPESEIQSERSRLLSEMTGFHPCKLKQI